MSTGFEPLLTPEQVSEILGLGNGVSGIYELTRGRSKNRLRVLRVGKCIRIAPADLRAYLERAARDVETP